MKIAIFPLGPLETNCYLVHNTKEAVIFDVGGDPARVINYLQKNELTLTHILCTHLHFDHTLGVQPLSQATGAKIFASNKDSFLMADGFGMSKPPKFEFANLEEGDFPILGTECSVFETPGHTPGGLSFYLPKASSVFVGDSLFYRSIGRTDFEGGDFPTLSASIRAKLYTLPDETVAYPGHGPHTTIGDEKILNPYVTA